MAEAAVELRAILDSAEEAASAQDFVSAEHYLRQAAAIQEAQLGPAHPDLANTLNNLGIVFEQVGKPSDAEASYRRAYAIATATRAPDDPLVVTSKQNLRDFCTATGRPFELAQLHAAPSPASRPSTPVSPPRPAVPPPRSPSVPITPPPPRTAPPPRVPRSALPATPAAAPSSVRAESAAMTSLPRELVVVALASVIAILGMIALLVWPSRTSVAPTPAPTAAPAPPAGLTVPREEATKTTKETTAPPKETTPAVAEAPPAAVGGSPRSAPLAAVSLVEAKLCRSLSTSDWQCTLLASPAAPGRVFFYTRVKAGRDTTVQHRWYINGNLLQNVELRIGANAGAGFRTYSRNTVAAERRGTWTIELRDASGALLHEERFVVQ
jgi:hypothetical protein